MAQLVVIHENCAKRKVERGIRKTEAEDHAIQAIGDIIGTFEDNHQFSSTELDIFGIIHVQDFTKEELENELPYPTIEKICKLSSTDWTLETPEQKEAWHRKAKTTWYFLEKEPKFKLSIKTLNGLALESLASPSVEKIMKKAILSTICDRIADTPINLVEVTDLNK